LVAPPFYKERRRFGLSSIEGAANGSGSGVENVGVDHRGGDIGVTEQFLYGTDVIAVFKEVGGEGVAEGMARRPFSNACFVQSGFERTLEVVFVDMVTANDATTWGSREFGRGKQPEPTPFFADGKRCKSGQSMLICTGQTSRQLFQFW
jgi:hypothetical protein